MTEEKSILILEDERDMRDAIARAFLEHRNYRFNVRVAESPQDCIDKGFDQVSFDVYLVDLEMKDPGSIFFGHMFIAIRAFEVPGSVVVVYSRHGEIEDVIRAIRSGATDFIVKGECLPHHVPDRIVALLKSIRDDREREQSLRHLVCERSTEWNTKYAGQVIALVGPQVVATGATRLAALVNYQRSRKGHPEWPDEPQLVRIPDMSAGI